MLQPTTPTHIYEIRPRRDHRGVDLISDVLPFGRLWYDGTEAVAHAIGYAMYRMQEDDGLGTALP